MSHPHSDAPGKDDTEKFSGDSLKRAPKRPRNSKRPMSKTIGFGVQSPIDEKADVPRMGEQDLWKALDGAITKATQEDMDNNKGRKTIPKSAAPQKSRNHKTQLGMPAISPVAPAMPKPIPVTGGSAKMAPEPSIEDSVDAGDRRRTKTGHPQTDLTPSKPDANEAFMKTVAQASVPTVGATAEEESGTEMLSADELLELEPAEEETTIPTDRTSNNPPPEDIELTTLPPEPIEPPPNQEPPKISMAKTERLVSLGPALEANTSPVPEEEVIHEDIVMEEEDGEVGLLEAQTEEVPPLETHGSKKKWLVIGGGAAAVLGVLGAVSFVLFLKPHFFPSTPPAAAIPAPAQPARKAASSPADAPNTLAASVAASRSPAPQDAPTPGAAASPPPEQTTPAREAEAVTEKGTPAGNEVVSPADREAAEEGSPGGVSPAEDNESSPEAEEETTAVQAAAPKERAAGAPSAPGMVTITLNGVPTGADILVDGRSVQRRFTVPRSLDAIKVEVRRPGFEAKVKRIVPGRDKQIRIRLKKL